MLTILISAVIGGLGGALGGLLGHFLAPGDKGGSQGGRAGAMVGILMAVFATQQLHLSEKVARLLAPPTESQRFGEELLAIPQLQAQVKGKSPQEVAAIVQDHV